MPSLSPPPLASVRRSRYTRDTPGHMLLTPDDLEIIRHIAKHRFLRSSHLIRLLPHRSEKKLVERLCVLFHNGFLDRPRAQLDYYAAAGSAPMVYALGNQGAAVLAEVDGAHRTHVDWADKNRSAGRLFIDHTLGTADVMVAMHCAANARNDVRIIEAHEIYARAPKATPSPHHPFALKIRAHHNGTSTDLAVIPDQVFGLDFVGKDDAKYFFLEADRATMPVMRANLMQTSMLRKFLAYLAGGGAANVFGRQLGIGNFRVLTVTTTCERTETMIAALKEAAGGAASRQFLFTDIDKLAAASDVLTLDWTSGKGEAVRLVD